LTPRSFLAFLLGIHLDFKPEHVFAIGVFIVLGSGLLSTFSLAVACLVKTRERFMGIGQALTMPLFSRVMYLSNRQQAHVSPRGRKNQSAQL